MCHILLQKKKKIYIYNREEIHYATNEKNKLIKQKQTLRMNCVFILLVSSMLMWNPDYDLLLYIYIYKYVCVCVCVTYCGSRVR